MRLAPVALVFIALATPACMSPFEDPRLSYLAVPPDFAVELHVEGDPADADPLSQTSHYVVQPNRRLHVARGHAASVRTFPPMLRVLTPEEYESLYRIVQRGGLMNPPAGVRTEASAGTTTPLAATPADPTAGVPAVVYEASITAGGVTRRYHTTAEESPATAELLSRLEDLKETLGPLSR